MHAYFGVTIELLSINANLKNVLKNVRMYLAQKEIFLVNLID